MRWIALLLIAGVLAGPLANLGKSIFNGNDAPVAAEMAFAEGDEEVADEGGGTKRFPMWDQIKSTGFIGILLLLLSITWLALTVQYAVEQKREKLIPPHIISELEQYFDDQAYDEAAELCEAEDCYLTRIVGAGLAQMENGHEAMMGNVEVAGEEENTQLFQKLGNIALIAGIAPMMGLYGTILGMMNAFVKIATTQGAASAAELAGGISMALATTFLGLTIAMPAMASYHFLKGRALNVSAETATIASSLFERFRAQQA